MSTLFSADMRESYKKLQAMRGLALAEARELQRAAFDMYKDGVNASEDQKTELAAFADALKSATNTTERRQRIQAAHRFVSRIGDTISTIRTEIGNSLMLAGVNDYAGNDLKTLADALRCASGMVSN